MKKLLLLLIVYGNMGFIASDKRLQTPENHEQIKPADYTEATGLIVQSPDTYRVVMN